MTHIVGSAQAKVICDSIYKGSRLTSIEVVFPRPFLAEFNTHTRFSRNSASSRAIPVWKRMAAVLDNPYVPNSFGANQADIQAIERTHSWTGQYHVLRGVVDSSDPETIATIKISELIDRVKTQGIREVLLALNPDVPGETTMLYLDRRLHEVSPILSITRLARGLPMGSDLRYADDITLGSALKNRTKT
jgi:hypothetical protein